MSAFKYSEIKIIHIFYAEILSLQAEKLPYLAIID